MTALLEQHPKLSSAARLRHDSQSGGYVLLSPERGLLLNPSAAEIVRRCTGELSTAAIVAQLLEGIGDANSGDAAARALTTATVTSDVLDLLTQLKQRGLLVLDPPP